MHDGVNKIWIVRISDGMNLDGHRDNLSAIDALIRHALTWGDETTRAKIEETVAKALTHMDETVAEDGPESEEV